MIVSTFRLERDRADGRVSTRLYRLVVTNLEDRPFEYHFSAVITVPFASTLSPGRLNDAVGISVDALVSASRKEPFRRTGKTYTGGGYFRVNARQTVGIAMAPWDGWDGISSRSLKGYVTLRLPAMRTERRPFTKQPQSDRSVKVLLNPETQLVVETPPRTYPVYNDPPPFSLGPQVGPRPAPVVDLPPVKEGFVQVPLDWFEHTEPLHVASGKAENELTPEGVRVLTADDLRYAEDALKDDDEAREYRGSEVVADQDRAGALIELLCEFEDDSLADAVNKILESQKAAIRLSKP